MGLGTGWWQPEFERFGYEFPLPAKRARRFTETVATLQALFVGQRPEPVQQSYPPFLLAAQGPRMLETVARYGDACLASFGLSPAEISARNRQLDERSAAHGRPPAAIRRIYLWTPWVQEDNPWDSIAAFESFADAYRPSGISELILEEPRPDQAGVFHQIARHASYLGR